MSTEPSDLNLVKRNTELDDIKDRRGLKLSDVLIEQRKNHNALIDALCSMNNEIVRIRDSELTERHEAKLKDIQEKVIPEIKSQIVRSRSILEAKILERISAIEKENLLGESHRRRLHLIANGIPVQPMPQGQSEPTEAIVRRFLVDRLHLPQEFVDSIIFRDLHRLPKSNRHDGPPPVIIAFCLMSQRNMVLANAKELKGTNISLKSDLPKQLNGLRNQMLQERKRLASTGLKVRVVERSYLPVLQQFNVTTNKWVNLMIFDKKQPLHEALNPVLANIDLPVIEIHGD